MIRVVGKRGKGSFESQLDDAAIIRNPALSGISDAA